MLADKQFKTTNEDVGRFYWPAGLNPAGQVVFRRPTEEAARAVDEICIAELAALAKKVIAAGSTGERAIATMAREVGLHQIRVASRGRIENAMQIVLGAS